MHFFGLGYFNFCFHDNQKLVNQIFGDEGRR